MTIPSRPELGHALDDRHVEVVVDVVLDRVRAGSRSSTNWRTVACTSRCSDVRSKSTRLVYGRDLRAGPEAAFLAGVRRLVLMTLVAAAAVLAGPVAGAGAALTATDIRIGNHAAGRPRRRRLHGGRPERRRRARHRPEPFADGRGPDQHRASAGIQSTRELRRRARRPRPHRPGDERADACASARRDHRFKYVSLRRLRVAGAAGRRPLEGRAADAGGAQILRGRLGCLTLDSFARRGRAARPPAAPSRTSSSTCSR